MSYCRFSSDDFKSEVYVYEGIGDEFVIHVAAQKHQADTPIPHLPSISSVTTGEFTVAYQAQMDWLEKATLVPIDRAYAGHTFRYGTASECAHQLESLRDLGYHIPDGVIETLYEEKE